MSPEAMLYGVDPAALAGLGTLAHNRRNRAEKTSKTPLRRRPSKIQLTTRNNPKEDRHAKTDDGRNLRIAAARRRRDGAGNPQNRLHRPAVGWRRQRWRGRPENVPVSCRRG